MHIIPINFLSFQGGGGSMDIHRIHLHLLSRIIWHKRQEAGAEIGYSRRNIFPLPPVNVTSCFRTLRGCTLPYLELQGALQF